jgi:BirA family transcriptional regulator, biotin operon repressor / biotin---[acetyl-CoA-carboxylase] ligase
VTWQVISVGETGSTNDDALARSRTGAPHGTVIVADSQTRGRGRQGRVWHSPSGANLYLSVILRLSLAPAAAPPLTLAAGVAVADALKSLGFQPSIKWPNDVLLDGRKVAGILTETATRGDRMEVVVIGVGINVNIASFPPELSPIATSLRIARGAPLDKAQVLSRVLTSLEAWIDRFVAEGAAVIAQAAWKERSHLLGTRVRVSEGGRVVEGTATDLDDEGALWLEADGGRRLRVLSGEVLA